MRVFWIGSVVREVYPAIPCSTRHGRQVLGKTWHGRQRLGKTLKVFAKVFRLNIFDQTPADAKATSILHPLTLLGSLTPPNLRKGSIAAPRGLRPRACTGDAACPGGSPSGYAFGRYIHQQPLITRQQPSPSPAPARRQKRAAAAVSKGEARCGTCAPHRAPRQVQDS